MTDPHVKVLAYSVDASWSDSPSRTSKLHAAADPTNEHSSAACSERIPLKNHYARLPATSPFAPEWVFYTAVEFHRATLTECKLGRYSRP